MSDLERPDLGLQAEDDIELAFHEIDNHYWDQLVAMQVPDPGASSAFGSSIIRRPPPPRRLGQLTIILQSYAEALFRAEAIHYPDDPRLKEWLVHLASRTIKRMIQRIHELEAAGKPRQSLVYHGLQQSHMQPIILEALWTVIRDWPKPVYEDTRIKKEEPAVVAPSNPSTESLSKQIDDLREEARLTVEDLAEALDVAPRSIYRHLSGKTEPRKRQIAAYEKLFSARLNRVVRLKTSA